MLSEMKSSEFDLILSWKIDKFLTIASYKLDYQKMIQQEQKRNT